MSGASLRANLEMTENLTESQLAYREYLKSDHWRALRLAAFRKWGRKCFKCPVKFGLDVHHLVYRFPWTLGTVDDVRPCCRPCHEKEHGLVRIVPRDVKRHHQRKRSKHKKKSPPYWMVRLHGSMSKRQRKRFRKMKAARQLRESRRGRYDWSL